MKTKYENLVAIEKMGKEKLIKILSEADWGWKQIEGFDYLTCCPCDMGLSEEENCNNTKCKDCWKRAINIHFKGDK